MTVLDDDDLGAVRRAVALLATSVGLARLSRDFCGPIVPFGPDRMFQ
jgi:hypothetical protein